MRWKMVATLAVVIIGVFCVVCLVNGFLQTQKLFSAVKKNDYEAAEMAIDGGAWVNKRQHLLYLPTLMDTNKTPLIYACRNGNERIVELLVKNGADVNRKDNYTNETPLLAALNGSNTNRFDVAWYLIESGADIHASTQTRSPILETIIVYDSDDEKTVQEGFLLFQYLYENGADISMRWGSESALTYAARYNNYNVVRFLIENKLFSVNDADRRGDTALIYAAQNGNQSIAKLLLEFGADVNLKNNDQKTAHDYAVENGYCELAELLK